MTPPEAAPGFCGPGLNGRFRSMTRDTGVRRSSTYKLGCASSTLGLLANRSSNMPPHLWSGGGSGGGHPSPHKGEPLTFDSEASSQRSARSTRRERCLKGERGPHANEA